MQTMSQPSKGNQTHWTIQQVGMTAGRPWFALQKRDHKDRVTYQYTGFDFEIAALREKYAINAEAIPAAE